VEAARAYILSALSKAEEPVSETRFRFEFLASPARILGNELGNVQGLEVEDTTLVPGDGEPQAKRLGTKRVLAVDTVVFCIGDRVDEEFGLPVRRNEFVKNPDPRFPVNGLSYEAYDPDADCPIDRVFVAGWSREASSGLVGVARKDGENGTQAVCQYLQTLPSLKNMSEIMSNFQQRVKKIDHPVVTKLDLMRLEEVECARAVQQELEEFKFCTNEEMLAAMGLGVRV
jgi:ferredoxin--NADP+ reductase